MKYLSVLLFLVICTAANAAVITNEILYSPINKADTDSVFRKRSISVGANYGSDILFFGRTGPIKYPFVSTDVIFNSRSGFFVYGSGVKVLGYNPLIDEIDLGTGYLYKQSKNFSGSISYTRFLFNKDAAQVIRSASSNDVNFKNSYDWKLAKSSIVFDYLFGKEDDFFLTLNTSKYIETNWSVFDDKDYLSFNPSISAILGTQNFVGKYYSDHSHGFLLNGIISPEGEGQMPRHNNGRFNGLNYSIKLPVAYNRPHYTLEASCKYSIPVNVEGELKNRHEVFLNLTFYYLFF